MKTQKIVSAVMLAATATVGIMTGCSEKKSENTMSNYETPIQSTNVSTVSEGTTNPLQDAYELSMTEYDSEKYSQEQYVLYGTYNPFSVTITHILNNKSGIDFTSYSHTGLPVGVFVDGEGAENFDGYYDNTDIFHKMAELLDVK